MYTLFYSVMFVCLCQFLSMYREQNIRNFLTILNVVLKDDLILENISVLDWDEIKIMIIGMRIIVFYAQWTCKILALICTINYVLAP